MTKQSNKPTTFQLSLRIYISFESMHVFDDNLAKNVEDPRYWNLGQLNMQHRSLKEKEQSMFQETLEPLGREQNSYNRSSVTSSEAFDVPEKKSFNIMPRVNEKKMKLENLHYEQVFKDKLGLKKILRKHKIKAIVNNFQKKARRNLSASSPVEYEPFQIKKNVGFSALEGLKIPNWLNLIRAFLSLLFILVLLFAYTLALVFPQLEYFSELKHFQRVAVCYYLLEFFFKTGSVKTENGRKITKVKELSISYFKSSFLVDFCCVIILIVDLIVQAQILFFFRMIILLKIKQAFSNLEALQNFFINNLYKQQYWTLLKVFIVNFMYAHCLAILLVAMSNLNHENNWLTKLNIKHCQWYEVYAWAYYWGATIMLTVGFGDISPVNYKEAVCVTIIETISCILLAYNINCVGNLIANIRTQENQKNKKLKIIRRLATENKLSEDLEWKVCNFINESEDMKKNFQFSAEKEVISQLPPDMKGEILKESNRCVFKNLTYLKSLTQKTLIALSEHIEMKITHPEQIIYKANHPHKFLILRNGIVGYCMTSEGSMYHHAVIDSLQVRKDQTPRVLHLNFFNPSSEPKYLIKSLKYSMISDIELEKALKIIKYTSDLDYEHFCYERDKSKHFLDEYEIVSCQFCTTKHTKMACPKLHFMPIKQKIMYKYLSSLKKDFSKRKPFIRYRNPQKTVEKPLLNYGHEFLFLQKSLFGFRKRKNRSVTQKQVKDRDRTRLFPVENTRSQEIELIKQNFDNLEKKFEEIMRSYTIKKSDSLEESDFWELETDKIYNFKYYFKEMNSNQLKDLSLQYLEQVNFIYQ